MGEGLPQFAALDVVGDVGDLGVAELAVAQPRHRVVFVEALLRLGGRLDVPGQQRRAERLGDFLGQHGLAGAGLALHQQRALQHDRGVDGDLEVVGGDVVLGAGKFHFESLPCCLFLSAKPRRLTGNDRRIGGRIRDEGMVRRV